MFLFNFLKFFLSVSSYKPRDRRLVASIYISTINREHVFINALSLTNFKKNETFYFPGGTFDRPSLETFAIISGNWFLLFPFLTEI